MNLKKPSIAIFQLEIKNKENLFIDKNPVSPTGFF